MSSIFIKRRTLEYVSKIILRLVMIEYYNNIQNCKKFNIIENEKNSKIILTFIDGKLIINMNKIKNNIEVNFEMIDIDKNAFIDSLYNKIFLEFLLITNRKDQ